VLSLSTVQDAPPKKADGQKHTGALCRQMLLKLFSANFSTLVPLSIMAVVTPPFLSKWQLPYQTGIDVSNIVTD
jgi:hypothetical protein